MNYPDKQKNNGIMESGIDQGNVAFYKLRV